MLIQKTIKYKELINKQNKLFNLLQQIKTGK